MMKKKWIDKKKKARKIKLTAQELEGYKLKGQDLIDTAEDIDTEMFNLTNRLEKAQDAIESIENLILKAGGKYEDALEPIASFKTRLDSLMGIGNKDADSLAEIERSLNDVYESITGEKGPVEEESDELFEEEE